jgi:hypothetical protein
MLNPFRAPPRYDTEEQPPYPPDGDWRVPVFYFDREHVSSTARDSRWGAGFVVRLTVNGESWVGYFSAGPGGLDGLFATPDPHRVCCVVNGFAYVVDVTDPIAGSDIAQVPTLAVTAIPEADRLLLVSFTDVTALGPRGIAWRTNRLVLDDLAVVETSRERIVCTGWIIPGVEATRVVLDAETGAVLEGQPPNWLQH